MPATVPNHGREVQQIRVLTRCTHQTRLGDWCGNILQIGRRQYLLFISERSRLPVVIPIREAKHLEAVFAEAVCDVLAAVGVGAADIAADRAKMSGIAFGRTNNRSLLGTLNDFAFMAQQGSGNLAEPESPEELMRFLSQTPILPLDRASPIDLTRTAFEVALRNRSSPTDGVRLFGRAWARQDCPHSAWRSAVLTRPARSR
jgi:hypothetical protein